MCGKYRLSWDEESLSFGADMRQWLLAHPEVELTSGDIVPSLAAPVMTAAGWRAMRFGIQASFMKRALINARSETAAERAAFTPLLKSGRCLVPAEAFYEWSAEKEPFLFALPAGMMYMAGLYADEGTLPGFVILTREAAGRLADIHPRMPLILGSPELREAWLRQDGLAEAILKLPDEALHGPLSEMPGLKAEDGGKP